MGGGGRAVKFCVNWAVCILLDEVELAIKKMKAGKAPEGDGIAIDMIKEGGKDLKVALVELHNRYQSSEEIPEEWQNAIYLCSCSRKVTTVIQAHKPSVSAVQDIHENNQ